MSIKELVNKYEKNRDYYLSDKYNETLLRSDFLDILFELLGWDIKNSKGQSTFEREVILEEGLHTGKKTKKPDYTFRLYNERKFFLEAKKPHVKIEMSDEPAFQIRRYGFTAKLKISVLSNFEYLIIYDCSTPVQEQDNHNSYCIKKYHYSEYEEKFDEIKRLLGKESVYNGTFDKEWESIENQIQTYSIDDLFLEQINKWRMLLGKALFELKNDIDEIELNDIVQSYINSIVFLRVCEDRNIEQYYSLMDIKNSPDNNLKLIEKLKKADEYYNSGIFQLPYIEDFLAQNASVFWQIISDLYYPNSSYSFAVMSSEILGNIYEIMLQDKLYIKDNTVILDRKPENIDRDVVTTPNFIIREIIDKTIRPYIENQDIDIFSIKIADIACGSGAFLLESFQYLNDYLIDYYKVHDVSKLLHTGIGTYKLKFNIKKDLLLKCFYGVDKDYNAIKTTEFGLLLKLLEDENIESLPANQILPKLNENIFWGNSLISNAMSEDSEIASTVNAFDFNSRKFDIIIGNPPYMKTEDIKAITPIEKSIYESNYKSAYKQYDKYFLFIERSLQLLNSNGIIGYILPNKFMKVGAGFKLRQLLKEKKCVKEIISFGANQIFRDKTTYTNILILREQPNEQIKYLEINNLNKWLLRDYDNNKFSNNINYTNLLDDTWIMYPSYLETIYNKINHKACCLRDFVGTNNILNGIQTSRNDYFVFTLQKEDAGYYYFNKDNIEYKVEKDIVRPYYETPSSTSDDTLSTYKKFKPNSFVIYPYKSDNGQIKLIEYDELQKQYPYCYDYFIRNKDKFLYSTRGSKRDIKPPVNNENEWYRYGRQQALQIGDIKKKIVVGVLSQGNKYSIDESQTLISSGGTAGYCMIILPQNSPYSIYYLQAILNSKFIEWMALLIGEIFRGGYVARGTKVLEKLPIKTIDFSNKNEKDIRDKIASLQEKLIFTNENILLNKENRRKEKLLINNFKRTKQLLDMELLSLYGMTQQEFELIPSLKDFYAIN